MSGSLVPALLVGGFILVFGIALRVIMRDLRWVRSLHRNMVDELTQLKSLLSQRHLVLSHLVDLIPYHLHGEIDQTTLQSRLERAETVLASLDPADPHGGDLRTLADCEVRLFESVKRMLDILVSCEDEPFSDAIYACIDGLEKSTLRVLDSMTTYNSATITYYSFLQSSAIARRFNRGGFEILDLGAPDSGISGTSSTASNRVIT